MHWNYGFFLEVSGILHKEPASRCDWFLWTVDVVGWMVPDPP